MYKFLDHPSEMLIEVEAGSLDEVFNSAATALFEVMTDTSGLHDRAQFPVELVAPDRSILLVDWLNRLIYIHEVEDVFLARFDARVEHSETQWKLKALVGGERIGQNQERRSHVKSATFGQMEWLESPAGYRVRFLLDV